MRVKVFKGGKAFIIGLVIISLIITGAVGFDIWKSYPNFTDHDMNLLIKCGAVLFVLIPITIFELFTTCFEWIMDEEGCTFVFMTHKRKYRWEELTVKWRMEYVRGKNAEIFYVSAKDYPNSVKRYNQYSWLHPYTAFYIFFCKGKEYPYFSGQNMSWHVVEDVDKNEFFEKLSSWGVEVPQIGFMYSPLKK